MRSAAYLIGEAVERGLADHRMPPDRIAAEYWAGRAAARLGLQSSDRPRCLILPADIPGTLMRMETFFSALSRSGGIAYYPVEWRMILFDLADALGVQVASGMVIDDAYSAARDWCEHVAAQTPRLPITSIYSDCTRRIDIIAAQFAHPLHLAECEVFAALKRIAIGHMLGGAATQDARMAVAVAATSMRPRPSVETLHDAWRAASSYCRTTPPRRAA